jgi:hypothetical protein
METLDKHFRSLSKASFARYGFAYGDLIAQWPEIVGAALGQFCEPERIKWPRVNAETTTHGNLTGGTLVIRAAAGRGLDLQHEGPQIIERINRYFGYGAISAIKIMQGRFMPKQTLAPAITSPAVETMLAAKLDAIADDKLRDALNRLGRGILTARRSSPQDK